jgi:hypothetical protein
MKSAMVVYDPRLGAVDRVLRNSGLLRDLVGGREADPVDVWDKRIGMVAQLFNCLLAVGSTNTVAF